MPARVLGLFALLFVVACGEPENGPLMNPGQDCMSCHAAGEEAASYTWSVAGTVFDSAGNGLRGVQIKIEDGDGLMHALTSNAAGNFYAANAMKEPFQSATLLFDGRQAFSPHSPGTLVGSCNACHTVDKFELIAP